jgi:hypothetical protein
MKTLSSMKFKGPKPLLKEFLPKKSPLLSPSKRMKL